MDTAMNLSTLAKYFSDEDAARTLLEEMRWGKTPTCPHCGVRIINGVGGGANPPPVNPPPFNPQPPINIAPPPINVAPPPPNVGNDTEPELAPHTRPARSNSGLIIGLVVGSVVLVEEPSLGVEDIELDRDDCVNVDVTN